MLQFVFGRSKSGKTHYIREYMASLAKTENKLLLIVPDQQTFDTEKAFLSILGPSYVSNVTVVGFKRLCQYVFNACAYRCDNYADDSVKALLMSVALEETSDSLRLYGDKFDSPSLINMMQKLHSEFIRDKVDIASLREPSDKFEKVLCDKLYDASVVLSAFDAILTQSFEDPDGELNVALSLIRENGLFEGYTVAVDSFLSFSKLELDVLEVLLQQSSDMLITLSTDGLSHNEGIFAMSSDTESKLRRIAKNNNINIAKPVLCSYNEYFKSPELQFVEENIFTLHTDEDEKIKSSWNKNNLELYSASDIYDECDYVGRNIRRLVMEDNYRYSDIAVVTRDYDRYKVYLDTVFRQYDIPSFLDLPTNVLSKPLIKMVLSAFECIRTSFSKDSVLSLIKCGLTNLNEVEIASFENYIFTWSYSGKSLLSEFTANPRGFADEFSTNDLYELTNIENTRKFIIDPLLKFRESLKDATVTQMCSALYELLLELGVREKLSSLCESLLENSLTQLAQEQLRIWEVFVETLNRTVAVVGDRYMSASRLSELLKLQFMNLEIAFIPKSLDEVTVGDVERIRLSDKKVVFVVGAVEGEFPKTEDHSGFFTNHERQLLTSQGFLADETLELQYYKERYNCYYALTSASDKLFLSYPAVTISGAVNLPSELISEISSLFEEIYITKSDNVDIVDKLWSDKAAFDFYSSRFGSADELTCILKSYYEKSPEYNSVLRSLERALSSEPYRVYDKNNLDKLYGKDIRMSASQVETFHSCKFMYFCKYGLRLQERKKANIDPLEFGSFVHFILEKFLSSVPREELSALNDNDIETKVSDIVNEYVKLHLGGIEDKSSRFAYLIERTKNSTVKLIGHLLREINQSEFVPDAYELQIGEDVPPYVLELDNGDRIIIRGKIDRVDICEKNGEKYIRILDYKTGDKTFSLSDVMAGLNLQMLIYLSAITKNPSERYPEKMIPAGILYVPAVFPIVNAKQGVAEDKIRAEVLKELAMNGLILNDEEIIKAMEKNANGIFLPVKSKDGSISGEASLATLEEFGAIFNKIDEIISQMGQELKNGDVSAVPVSGNGNDGCVFCDYNSICRFREGDKMRWITKMSREEILEELGLSKSEVSEE